MNKLETPRFKTMLIIAFPMIVSNASETAMRFMDRVFLKDLGRVQFESAMSGGLTSFVFMSIFIGLAGYTTTLVSQYFGARKHEHCVESAVQGLYIGLFSYPLLLALMPLAEPLFTVMQHRPEQIDAEMKYFRILLMGGLFAVLRQGVVGYFIGIGKTRLVMTASVIGTAINIPLNYVLIFKKNALWFDGAGMGIEGAAIATVISSAFIFFYLLFYFVRHEYYRDAITAGHWKNIWKIRPALIGKLVRYGLPAGLEIGLNVFAFNYFVLLMQGISPDVSTAVSITFTYDMVAFIPMLGLGIAVTSLVGQQMGGQSPGGAKKATKLALITGYVYAAVMMLIFIFGADILVALFATAETMANTALVELTKTMLRLAALYILADVTNLVFAGSLRGAGDTKYVAVISVVLHWVMVVLVTLGRFHWKVGPMGLWYMFIGFVFVLGASILVRYKTGAWEKIRVIEH